VGADKRTGRWFGQGPVQDQVQVQACGAGCS
jgi:hypothetical protein